MYKVLIENQPASKEIPVRVLLHCMMLILFSFLLSACGTSGLLGSGSWQASGLQNQQLRVLAVNGKDLHNVYTGNAQGQIFVSTDAGQTWTEQSTGLPLPDPVHALIFDNAGQKLYAATDKGLFTKGNNSTQWTIVAGLPAKIFTALAFEPDAAKVIYAGTAGQGVYISTDNGSSWRATNRGLSQETRVNDLSFDPVQHQVWAATSDGAYRSADRGASWQAFNTGLPPVITVNTVVPASISGGKTGLLYMGTNHGFFLSQDSGTHWIASQEALSGTSIHAILLDFRDTNGTSLYVATDAGVFHTTQNGQTWLTVASNLPKNMSVYALAFGADNYAQLYVIGAGVYQFPGTGGGGGIDPARILPILLVVVFFFLLYRLSQRGRSTRREILKPERIQETSDAKTDNPAN